MSGNLRPGLYAWVAADWATLSVSTGSKSPWVPLGTGSPVAGLTVRDEFGSVDPVLVS